MRTALLLAAAALAAATLAGCLSGGEDVDPAAPVNDSGPQAGPGEGSEDGGEGSVDNDTAGTGPADDDANETDGTEAEPAIDNPPTAVVAHVDTGINPYHETFREDSRLTRTHPSEYVDGYPEDAEALNLTLDADSFAAALEADRDVWANVTQDQLYWIPGTRIVGAISLADGGQRGNATDDPVMTAAEIAQAVQEGNLSGLLRSHDTNVLDNHGHGTMTASRAVGRGTSLAPNARLVSIEGLGPEGVRWAADAGWIDVQTNSWVDLVPPPANRLKGEVPGGGSETEAFAHAAERMVTVAASGNGAAYQAGVAPTPTYALATAPDGVLLVGAHDNGYLAPWSGSPPHVVADGFRPLAAVFDATSEVRPHGYSCCTSAAAPYAAGAAAHLIEQARRILDDRSLGIEDGTVAEGAADRVGEGPLADGVLDRGELRTVLLHTAQQRPQPTRHDGATHWAADPGQGGPSDPTEPGGNAYCAGCWSTPVRYSEIPAEVPTFPYTGYGAVNVVSDQRAVAALFGGEVPDRSQADQFYEADQTVREAVYPPAETP